MFGYTFEDLMYYIQPSAWHPTGLRWERHEQTVDAALPADYVKFMGDFGPGGIAGYLSILAPVPVDGDDGLLIPSADYLENSESPYPAFPEEGGLIFWGANSSADNLFYCAVGHPDDWPIVVKQRHHHALETGWKSYECTLIDFLVRMFRGEFEENPLGSDDLWKRGPEDLLFQTSLFG